MILYALISRGTTVLCEHTRCNQISNSFLFIVIEISVLAATPATFSKSQGSSWKSSIRSVTESTRVSQPLSNISLSYQLKCEIFDPDTYDKHLFHIMIQNNLIYLAMTTQEFERRIVFAFLERIRTEFEATFAAAAATAVAYEMNKRFSKVLEQEMTFFSDSAKSDKISALKENIEDVKQVMAENIEKILDRGEKIELLVDKTGDLQQQAFKFKRSGEELKRRMWWSQFKLQLLIGGSISTVLLIIILSSTRCFGTC